MIVFKLTKKGPIRRPSLPSRVTADDRNADRAFVQALSSEAIWLDYLESEAIWSFKHQSDDAADRTAPWGTREAAGPQLTGM